MIEILENNDIYKKLWECMQRFPLHTSLHQIVINFIKPLLSTEHLSKIITFYIPNLITAYKARDARILSASSLYLLKKMYKYKEGKEIIESFQEVSEELKEKFELFHQSHQRSRLQSPSFAQWNLKHGFFADDKFGFI
ncbi:hypothetical protein TVAG_158610 [Trichomonas vaginalis G3]|uniref:Uncharacterized protein n=1 Tax=Trichomonas vaginalis (strain ATCC PRA-98 / G3) TaxID=412133 RepID=A2E6P0_TRIV3|nr:hypothetical protein TVAGG3_0779690 [Trichomonas vaginalis G3]EAY11634.1 hypothetical protein TVAG_158610 [Trichomonas vaginalis G3]KAI5494961.1 hypothetical protein TVAGG3_0779690 [Trichomonas vaginalis G3]|eukprot:XP_001323857.1 hypothetical protein [Trichomonas vaginalis G3]